MKILIYGKARHGKDTVAEMIRDIFGLSFNSSSQFALHNVIYPALKDEMGYLTPEECYRDKEYMRVEWYNAIAAYNKDDKAALIRDILGEGDIYVGLRSYEEYRAAMEDNLFDLVVKVDATARLGNTEGAGSYQMADVVPDIVIYNNESLDDLRDSVAYNLKAHL